MYDPKCHILKEPYDLTIIPNLDKDKEEQTAPAVKNANQANRSVEVYLNHCKKFANEYIERREKTVPAYPFSREDMFDQGMADRETLYPAFYDGTLNMLLIDKMMRDGSYDFYSTG